MVENWVTFIPQPQTSDGVKDIVYTLAVQMNLELNLRNLIIKASVFVLIVSKDTCSRCYFGDLYYFSLICKETLNPGYCFSCTTYAMASIVPWPIYFMTMDHTYTKPNTNPNSNLEPKLDPSPDCLTVSLMFHHFDVDVVCIIMFR